MPTREATWQHVHRSSYFWRFFKGRRAPLLSKFILSAEVGEVKMCLKAYISSVLKSGPVQSFCLFWRRPDCDRLRRFQIFFGPQPNWWQPVVYGCMQQLWPVQTGLSYSLYFWLLLWALCWLFSSYRLTVVAPVSPDVTYSPLTLTWRMHLLNTWTSHLQVSSILYLILVTIHSVSGNSLWQHSNRWHSNVTVTSPWQW